jgi:hypothetical protein
MATCAPSTPEHRDRASIRYRLKEHPMTDGRFKPGQSGNPRGRPRGSRHRLSEAALADLCANFEAGGAEAIERCRVEDPVAYVRVVASLLPRQIEQLHSPLADLSDEELSFLDRWIEAHRAGQVDLPDRTTPQSPAVLWPTRTRKGGAS